MVLTETFSVLVTIAGVLMSIGHFPQAYKIWKRRSAKDVSLITYGIFTLGAYIWLAYGFVLKELPIIISFMIAVVGTTSVLILILRYR